jgi:hypothetical protein
MMKTTWWWKRLDVENDLMMKTTWWWERFDDENDLLVRWMKTIYLSTLNWVDKEFFLTFLYIASLEQTWQNSSNINPRIELRALISPTRSDINPRVGFELLSETQFYGQASRFAFAFYDFANSCVMLWKTFSKRRFDVSSTSTWSIRALNNNNNVQIIKNLRLINSSSWVRLLNKSF